MEPLHNAGSGLNLVDLNKIEEQFRQDVFSGDVFLSRPPSLETSNTFFNTQRVQTLEREYLRMAKTDNKHAHRRRSSDLRSYISDELKIEDEKNLDQSGTVITNVNSSKVTSSASATVTSSAIPSSTAAAVTKGPNHTSNPSKSSIGYISSTTMNGIVPERWELPGKEKPTHTPPLSLGVATLSPISPQICITDFFRVEKVEKKIKSSFSPYRSRTLCCGIRSIPTVTKLETKRNVQVNLKSVF